MSEAAQKKDKTKIGDLDTLVTYHLRRAQVAAFGHFTGGMKEDKITPGQFGVLALIVSNDGISQSAVARALGVERSTMVAIIDGLQDRGLVIREPSKIDRRSNALRLSDKGRQVYDHSLHLAHLGDAKTMAALSEDEAAQLLALLQKVNHGI